MIASFRNERLGLIMILASLAVITVIILLLFHYQRDLREDRIRGQGIGLARLLGGMSWEQLVGQTERQGPLQIMGQSQGNVDFAYGVVVDTAGQPARTISAPGVIVPQAPLPREPSAWLGERTLQTVEGGSSILEFYAPLFSSGDLIGHIRLGYFQPSLGLEMDQLPFVATLALPIFLLTPLFYFLIRREIRPLQQVNQKVEQLLEEGDQAKVEVHASGELREFLERLNHFVDFTKERIQGLEREQSGLITSSKLLSYKQSRVETVLHTLPEAVVVLDESGVVSYANAKLGALLDVDHNEVVGQRPSDWCNEEQALALLSRFQEAGTAGCISDPLRFTPSHSPGRVVEMNTYPLFAPRGEEELLGTLIVLRDVTEEQGARNSQSEFVAQVAHELKTPLNVLGMYSESLMDDQNTTEDFRIEAINVIHDEVERLSTLINNMLAINRFEMDGMHINRQRTRLNDLLEDAFNNISQSGRGKDLSFNIDLPRELSTLWVDKDLLRIAINNLLTNAIKYNTPGGTVTLSAAESDGDVEIRVSDSGIGIDSSEQQKIFGKFYRSEDQSVREQAGHGLGLSLTKHIVDLHQGELSVESIPGKGSSFAIRLEKGAAALLYAAN